MVPPETSARAAISLEPTTSGTPDFRRIVVPLDGSTVAEQALPHAQALADLTGAPLHLVRVLDPSHLGASDSRSSQVWLEDERGIARHYLERIEEELLQRQRTITVEYRLGPAARELLATAQPGDLIVMATHGRSGLGRWFLGSVAEAVVRQATVPVLLVRATPPELDSAAAGSVD